MPLPSLAALVLPGSCPGCGCPHDGPCPRCAATLRPAPVRPRPVGVDELVVPFAYEGAVREAVARLKYRNDRAALGWLAEQVALVLGASPVDALTWVPTTPARRRTRGFDHGALLARAVGARLGVAARPLLRRAQGAPQTGASRAARLVGPHLAARRGVPQRVLVLDDVVTTGATLVAAAGALRAAGAHEVRAAAVARTP